MKILLLNPPGRKNYLRDYYCSTVTKSDYYYHPVDLLYLSGTLSREHEVYFLEALSRGLSQEETLKEVAEAAPDVLICLVSAPSFDEDHEFLMKLKNQNSKIKVIGTGDIFREFGAESFSMMPFLDATLVDFSTEDILIYLKRNDGRPVSNMVYRNHDQLVVGQEKHGNGSYSIPAPRYDLFSKNYYRFPFVVQSPFMTVLSDFGCPYGCTFCPISTLGFKLRPIPEVIEELKSLWAQGYREVHFRDQTFGVNKKRTRELCEAIKKELPRLTWSCFSRVDVLDEERAEVMSKAGCHTVIVGIEFDNDKLQKVFKKNINKGQMFQAVEVCHKHKIRVAGTFIIGLPEQDEDSILGTGQLSRLLKLDFASFNLATPRLGTTWRKSLLTTGQIKRDNWKMDTVDGTTAWVRPVINFSRLNWLRYKLEKDFYLSPPYILKRLYSLRSGVELQTFLRNGLSMARGK